MTPWFSMVYYIWLCVFFKGLALQKISPGQTVIEIMHLHCDLDREGNSPFFLFCFVLFFRRPKDCNNTPSNQLSRRYGTERREIKCAVTLTLTLDKPTYCSHIALASGDAPSWQFWLQKVKWLRWYCPHKLLWPYDIRLQVLVYDILPPTTAITGYAIGLKWQ